MKRIFEKYVKSVYGEDHLKSIISIDDTVSLYALIEEYLKHRETIKTGIARLEPYKKWYDFNCQLFNGQYNVFVSRDLVDLHSIGGYDNIDEAIAEVIKWIKRVNKVKP